MLFSPLGVHSPLPTHSAHTVTSQIVALKAESLMTAYADIGGPFPLNDSELILSRAETHHIFLKTILFVVRQISQVQLHC